MKVVYLALILNAEDVEEQWEAVTGVPLLPFVHAHHLTLKFRPSDEEVAMFRCGVPKMLQVVGWGANERNQGFLVKPVPGFPCQNAFPHITVAVNDGCQAKDTNDLKWSKDMAHGLIFPAVSGWHDGTRLRTERPSWF